MPVGKVLIILLGTPMARAILTLKRVTESASSETLMGGNGRGPDEICRSIMFLRIELRDSTFSKREGLHM
jgi:hypothetical protein